MSLRWWLSMVLGLGLTTAAIAAQPGRRAAKAPPPPVEESDDADDDGDSPAKNTDDADDADDEEEAPAAATKPKPKLELGDASEEALVKKVSYLIGFQNAMTLKNQGINIDVIDVTEFLRGVEEAFAGKKLEMSEDEVKQAATRFDELTRRKLATKNKKEGEKNKQEGEAFLAENKKKKGVKTLPSGLQYLVLKKGEGASPKATDTVTVHYKGTFLNGNEFDSSYRRGQPAKFPVNQVIKGWTEALQLMKVGDKWQLFVPSGLAYKEYGRLPTIPPNATLIFEIELLKIDGSAAKAPAAEEN